MGCAKKMINACALFQFWHNVGLGVGRIKKQVYEKDIDRFNGGHGRRRS
jgi:hypothetical protein